jgi:hypothetical protein
MCNESLAPAVRSLRRLLCLNFLPVIRLLKCVGDLFGMLGLVMLGENVVGKLPCAVIGSF